MPPNRNIGRRSRSVSLDDDADFRSEAPKRHMTDPAWLIATAMLKRALASFPEEAAAESVCLFQLPSAVWLDGMPKVWGGAVFDGVEGGNADESRYWDVDWFYFTRGGSTEKDRRASSGTEDDRRGNDAVARALWEKLPLVGFSHDLTILPPDLLQAADLTLTLGDPEPDDVAYAAEAMTGERASDGLTADEAARLTPRLLRLAVRRDQTADLWVAKLRDLLLLEEAPVAAAPPPDAPRAAPDLSRLHGMPEAVEWGLALARDIRAYRNGELPWSAVDGGCLLSGPPGVGKTLYARALAKTCDVPLIHGGYSIWHSSGSAHQGDFLKAMRKSFESAKKQAVSILFIDEIDSFPDRGKLTHSHASYETQVVNSLLAEIDGADDRDGVVLIGACNHPEKLDPALVRSGRLDRHIRLRLPDVPALAAILREHLETDLPGVDLMGLAVFAAGASGADCERLVRGARRRARMAGRFMEASDLHGEIRGKPDGDADVRLAAIHEAGHVVAVAALGFAEVEAVSLRSSDAQGGAALMRGQDRHHLLARDVEQLLISLLAGRAAEEVVLGEGSSGAGGGSNSDLARATKLALQASLALGLDPASGLLWAGQPEDRLIPTLLAADPALAARTKARLAAAYLEALALIAARRGAVIALADALVKRGALDGDEIAQILSEHASAGEGA